MKIFPLCYKDQVCNKIFDKCKVNCAKLVFDWSNSPVFDESTPQTTSLT